MRVVPHDARRKARGLYWRGWSVTQIAGELNVKRPTVESWKQRDAWDKAAPLERVESSIDERLQTLIAKEAKTGGDFKEIDLLGRQLERTARVRRYEAPGGHEGDLNPRIANRNAGEKKKARKNHLSVEDQDKLKAAFAKGLFDYQLAWRTDLRTSTANVTRMILKSRQIGATFYFAREALIRAIETGNNQIFISASRAQANGFRLYIQAFVQDVCGKKLEGDPIVLDLDEVEGPMGEPPKLYFLGTNYRTAQSYHGDVYVDECFWIHGFEQLNKVASAMASQKRYRKTYFSTPSTIAHEAHAMWSGERFNRNRPKAERVKVDTGHDALKDGKLCEDRIWRQVVTVLDAEARGCDLFDIEELRTEYSPDEFDNLFLCQFVDDSRSMFPFTLMRGGAVDSWDLWRKDFNPYDERRPYGDLPVWIGYDPAESAAGDDAALVVLGAPGSAKEKFRVLEKRRLKGMDFQAQAQAILDQLERYNVQFIGIDTTGVGAAVWQLVVKKYPAARRFDYNVALKTQMVLKAKNVIAAGRLEFDAGHTDIINSFMAIRAELTGSQRQITYVASRAGDTGHADLAWAIMHALFNEPLDPEEASAPKSTLTIFGEGQDDGSGYGNDGEFARIRDTRHAGDRRRSGRGAHVRLRRSAAGARSPRVPGLRRMLPQRPLVRAAAADVGLRARL